MAFKFEIQSGDRLLMTCLAVSAALVVALIAISGVASAAQPQDVGARGSPLGGIRDAGAIVCEGLADRYGRGDLAEFDCCKVQAVGRDVCRADVFPLRPDRAPVMLAGR